MAHALRSDRLKLNLRMVRRRHPQRRGAMLVLVAVMFVVLMAFVGLMVDTSWMALAKTEQQFAVDEAARSALAYLLTSESPAKAGKREKEAIERGEQMFRQDRIGGRQQETDAHIEFGQAIFQPNGPKQFFPGERPISAARATSDVNEGTLTPVRLFFAPLFGLTDFRPRAEAVVAVQPIEMVLCLDASGTMSFIPPANVRPPGAPADTPTPGSRWFALRDAVELFLETAQQRNQFVDVGLVTFGGTGPAGASKDLSLPRAVRELELENIRRSARINRHLANVGKLGLQGSTDITAGIRESMQMLNASPSTNARQLIVVVSDGEHRTPHYTTASPTSAAAEAAAEGMTVHTLLVGPDEAQRQMSSIAEAGDGRYFGQSFSEAELIDQFQQILQTLTIVLVD